MNLRRLTVFALLAVLSTSAVAANARPYHHHRHRHH